MKWALRIGAALVVLVSFALGVLVFSLPRLAKSDAARARIQEATRQVLGAELRYAELDFGLLPPSLVVREPALLAVDAGEAPPLARADDVSLRVQLLPLLARRLEVSSLVVDGLALHLVRDANGIVLPGAPEEASPEPAPPRDEPDAPPSEDSGVALGIRTVTLRDAEVTLEDRTLNPPRTSTLGGIDVRVRGEGSGADRAVRSELDVARSDVDFAGMKLSGPLSAWLESDDLLAGTGRFEVDADAAELQRGADFRKPAGTRARIRGVLVREAGVLGIDDLEFELHDLVATGALRTGDDFTLRLEAAPFEVEGWEALVPALGLASPRGRLAISELVAKSDLAATHGRFAVQDLALQLPDTGPIVFTGDVVLAGASLFARDAQLALAGQPFTVSPKLDGLDGAPRFELRFETAGADTNALLGAFADLPDRLLGPLVAKGTLRAPLAGDRPLLERLAGDVELGIEGGRLVGTSILEAALGSLGKRLAALTREQGDARWERFYGEDFESLAGSLRFSGGSLIAKPATLRYRDYGVRLEGPIRLSDLGMDLRGALSLGPALDAELARSFGAPDDYTPGPRELVIESLTGTPTQPKVQLSGSSVASLATHYAKQGQREDLKRAVEKELGPGTGEIVDQGLDVLEGIFGGKR